MLFSISSYFGLDGFSGPGLQKLFGHLSLVLALPVFFFSAADYWRAAWISLRQRVLTIDVPIAAGIAALFAQSVYEVVSGRGEGYFDSLAGLLFFLLGGKLFQQKTYERLAFDRDYKSFFPLSVTRLARPSSAARVHASLVEEQVSLAQLTPGDHLALRHGELIPADARLLSGHAVIDYSFVTGESEPVEKNPGDPLFAGGRQIGGRIEIELTKNVSQSYLTSLWNQEAFRKDKSGTLDNLTNRYSQRFTKIILAIALGAALFWAFADPAKAVKAFTSVLIVACPCALALAAPFALGTAQRVLGRRNVFLKNPGVLESLARVDTLVFDKTGTLTAAGAGSVAWHGAPLSETEERWLYSMTRHSTHPLPVRIGEAIARQHFPEPVRSFLETPGCGMEASVAGQEIWMGSAAWLASRNAHGLPVPQASSPASSGGVSPPVPVAGARTPRNSQAGTPAVPEPEQRPDTSPASSVHVALNWRYRGCYHLASALRPATETLIARLAPHYSLALLSGDHAREQARFLELFGPAAALHFQQTPLNKLAFIRDLQASRKTVAMIGDGLNDAGALQQSDVGIAVVEHINAFSPASDVILAAGMIPRLADILRFAKNSVRTVRAAFLISTLYNIVGISIAASGRLSPIVCAILMPLSSITVVAFACGMTTWLGRGLDQSEVKP